MSDSADPKPVLMDNERQAVAEFRERLGDSASQYDDGMLLRFLVARAMDVDNAAEMLQKYLVWAASKKLDTLPLPGLAGNSVLYPVRGFKSVPDSNPDPLKKNCPQEYLNFVRYMGGASYHHVDKEGRPVFIDRLGLYDTKKWANNATPEAWLDFHIRSNEMLYRVIMDECTKTSGKFQDKNTVIFDCAGMGFHQFHWPALNLLKMITETDQAYYPERLGMLFIVNAPALFTRVWAIVKKWLDERMLAKIHILGADYQTVLLEYVEADKLPKFLGGNCTCEHMKGGCCPSPFVDDNNPDKKPPTLREGEYPYLAELEPGETHTFEVEVPQLDETLNAGGAEGRQVLLKWKFKATLPVRFEITYAGGDDAGNAVEAFVAPADHSPGPVVDQCVVKNPGTYTLTWQLLAVGESAEPEKPKSGGGFFGWAAASLGLGAAAAQNDVEYNVELEMVDGSSSA